MTSHIDQAAMECVEGVQTARITPMNSTRFSMPKLTGMAAVREAMSFAKLAWRLGVTRGAVSQWDKVPAERLPEVSRITGVPMEVLRPDMFASAR